MNGSILTKLVTVNQLIINKHRWNWWHDKAIGSKVKISQWWPKKACEHTSNCWKYFL